MGERNVEIVSAPRSRPSTEATSRPSSTSPRPTSR